MEFDYTKLKKQLTIKQFDHFLDYFTNHEKVRETIIDKVNEEGIYSEVLETNSFKLQGNREEVDFTNLTFEKVNENTIEVYIHKNSFINL
ncbi:hypothetical protein [Oceanobacillus caeni]|uniref:hypothetical protein n=1 Tax=Oceanobacillus caeni TaxID=405946 RepID=UPI00363652E7